MHYKQKYKGFSLVEIILYVGLLAVFIGGAVLFTWDIIYGQAKSQIQQDTNYMGEFVIKRVTYEIRNATSVLNQTPTSITLDTPRGEVLIRENNGAIELGAGTTGDCTVSAPCSLIDQTFTTTNFTITALGGATGDSQNFKIDLTIDSTAEQKEWQYSQDFSSSAEVRKK